MIREVQAETTEPPSSPCACSKVARKPSILFLWRSRANARCAAAATMHVDKDACRSRGLIVTNVVAVFATDSADHAGGILVAMLRKVAAADAYIRSRRWTANTRQRLPSRHQGEQQAGGDRGAGQYLLPRRVHLGNCRCKLCHVEYLFH